MQKGQHGFPSLEASNLETKPPSPVDIEENAEEEKEVENENCQ